MESTPEPGDWVWPCTDFSCIRREKGSESRKRGGSSPQFLRVPPPAPSLSLVPNSHNLSLELFCGLLGSFPGQAWECQGGEDVSLGGLAAETLDLGKGHLSESQALPCPGPHLEALY